MKTCMFKFDGWDGVGFAQANNMVDLFWQIDRVGDPTIAQVRWLTGVEATGAIFWNLYKREGDEPPYAISSMEDCWPLEILYPDDGEWVRPDWPEYEKLLRP